MEAGEAVPAGRRPLMARARQGAVGEEQREVKAAVSAAACGLLVTFTFLYIVFFFLCPPFFSPLHPSPSGSLFLVRRVWSTCPVRSGCASWGCLAWRKEAQGGTLLFSTAAWKELVAGWGTVPSPRQPETGERTWPRAAPGEVQVGQQEGFVLRRGD